VQDRTQAENVTERPSSFTPCRYCTHGGTHGTDKRGNATAYSYSIAYRTKFVNDPTSFVSKPSYQLGIQ
jgi:hypothetical protein